MTAPATSASFSVSMWLERETPGTYVYKARFPFPAGAWSKPNIETLYIMKAAYPDHNPPEKILVTIGPDYD